MDPSQEDIRAVKSAEIRNEFLAGLALCDKVDAIISRLPDKAVELCQIVCGRLLIYNPGRDLTVRIIKSLGAGPWKKDVNPHDPTKIDYKAYVGDVLVYIYGAKPPLTCRIVETEVEVPAHKAIKRELVCH